MSAGTSSGTAGYRQLMRKTDRWALRALAGLVAVVVLPAFVPFDVRPSATLYRMPSAIEVDTVRGVVTLPLHQGFVGRKVVWYIVTESSDRADAARRRVTWAPRLKVLVGTDAAQRAHETHGQLSYDAGVDLTPDRAVVGNPQTGFPPTTATPGSVADPFYSPFVVLDNGVVLNAPIVGDERAIIDRVESLDPVAGVVRLRMSRGYVMDQVAWYITTDASDQMVAAMEGGTLAPALRATPGEGTTNAQSSARTGILAVINGETGVDNPERQGLESAMMDGRAPLSILEHSPDPTGKNPIYSPAWDLHLVRWSQAAVANNQRTKIFSWDQARTLLAGGFIAAEGPNTARAGPKELSPARIVINCPVIAVFRR